ncbi:MAG: ribosomal protein S18-alanine N-acetyltransferase [Deltaproteobacteria bacterium]|nr:ribosomal protein S18-alanine N-acetyltransferase [Deltaproteobacteria bacterium]
MVEADLPAVAELESRCFPTPWGIEVLREEMKRDWGFVRVLRPAPGKGIVAFVCFWIVHDEVHVLVVATDPDHRGRGFARALLEDMIGIAGKRGVRYAMLEVRKSNEAAIGLYASMGFDRVGVRPRYYADNREDAVVMMLTLPEPETP